MLITERYTVHRKVLGILMSTLQHALHSNFCFGAACSQVTSRTSADAEVPQGSNWVKGYMNSVLCGQVDEGFQENAPCWVSHVVGAAGKLRGASGCSGHWHAIGGPDLAPGERACCPASRHIAQSKFRMHAWLGAQHCPWIFGLTSERGLGLQNQALSSPDGRVYLLVQPDGERPVRLPVLPWCSAA